MGGYGQDAIVEGSSLKQPLINEGFHLHGNSGLVKYPELYPSPEYSKEGSVLFSKYPGGYSLPGHYNPEEYLDLFPVDTPNTIPSPATDFKQRHEEPALAEPMPNNAISAVGHNAIPGDQSFDINSLLTFPEAASSTMQDSFAGDFSWQLLDGLEPAHMKEADLVQHLEANLPDEIYSLPSLEKDASYQMMVKDQDASYDMLSPVLEQSPYQAMPMDHSGSPLACSPEDSPISNQPTPVAMVPKLDEMRSDAGGLGVLWRKDLQNLFEKTFDLSELVNDFMVAPPSKEKSSLPMVDSPPPEVDKKPVILDPPLHSLGESPPKLSKKSELGKSEAKAKPTLLFGKHEGEMIHKLLVHKKGSRSKPVTRDKLISMPVEEFNSLLDGAHLSEIEVAFMKEWRRRGKNKAAAQIARKRKREEVSGLDQEVQNMRQDKARLEKRSRQLSAQVVSLKEKARLAEDKIYQKHMSVTGKSVTRKTHHILVTEDDQLLLVPRAIVSK